MILFTEPCFSTRKWKFLMLTGNSLALSPIILNPSPTTPDPEALARVSAMTVILKQDFISHVIPHHIFVQLKYHVRQTP